jgi:RNA polymerase sigma-70 factor (ECF subfamily)
MPTASTRCPTLLAGCAIAGLVHEGEGKAHPAPPSDDDVVARVRAGEAALFEVLMRRYNQRLFRAARAILGDDHEAEDVLQEAWVRAYAHLGGFAGRAAFSTWVTKIAVHEAFARRRQRKRYEPTAPTDLALERPEPAANDPERAAAGRELAARIEQAIDALPEELRVVFMLRAVEEMSVADTAQCLDIPEATVKTRLFRARGHLERHLHAEPQLRGAHAFLAERCDRVVAAVLARIGARRG